MRPSDDCAPPSSKNASADLSELGRTARRGLPLSVPRRRLRQRVFPGDLPRVPRHLAAAWGVTLGVVQARMEVLLLRMGGHLPAVSVTTRATGSTIRCIARRVSSSRVSARVAFVSSRSSSSSGVAVAASSSTTEEARERRPGAIAGKAKRTALLSC